MNATSAPTTSSWLVPLAFTLALVGVLAWTFTDLNTSDGPLVRITFDAGHGLQPDDDVKCRGITVGRVRSLELGDEGVEAVVEDHSIVEDLLRNAQGLLFITVAKMAFIGGIRVGTGLLVVGAVTDLEPAVGQPGLGL